MSEVSIEDKWMCMYLDLDIYWVSNWVTHYPLPKWLKLSHDSIHPYIGNRP